MSKYSIADLERLSGVKAHTIRIWEQRYQLLKPLRTSTNIRCYDDDELRKLLNVASLIRSGMKISQISELSEVELYGKLEMLLSGKERVEEQVEIYINQLIFSGLSYDEHQFEKTFSGCILRFGLMGTYVKVIYPLLEKLGLMWSKEETIPAQEHFVSNLIKQKLFTAIDALPFANNLSETFLLFLSEEEDHEMSLLFANYLLKSQRKKVIYLGQRVPIVNLEATAQACKPQYLMTFFVRTQPLEILQKHVNDLSAFFSDQTIIVSGNPWLLQELSFPENIKWFKTVEDFIQFLKIK